MATTAAIVPAVTPPTAAVPAALPAAEPELAPAASAAASSALMAACGKKIKDIAPKAPISFCIKFFIIFYKSYSGRILNDRSYHKVK